MSRVMSEPASIDSDEDDPLPPSAEKERLSARMLALIEVATAEERRKANDKGFGSAGEQRRRTDQPSNSGGASDLGQP